ncbi:lantibiotic dehydratase family protein [Christiangramia sp. SM2212]|uniref:Lantibiotic dehydratase family protein n=1 Tax=Christiangramia sediminicola TaxID=3073267 RepID=A0ABU1ERV4_9FLAO|nr:lantibiotic dehydratase family protein [Christiangramia sp. SM2212]MDR5591106.1 lantibiotic dehydratase family protein [Christiangramia sp. SM2212]
MKSRFRYSPFPNHIIRTPLLPLSYYSKITNGNKVEKLKLKKAFENPIVKEAIYLASPVFYEELEKWFEGAVKSEKNERKLISSFLKYLARISSRCTPFGLFAGCAVGTTGETIDLKMNDASDNQRHTRLDMDYLISLAQNLAENEIIKPQLKFYTNNSIYRVQNKYRYVEYEYIFEKRHHKIVGVNYAEYLELILISAQNGVKFNELANLLVDGDTDFLEASAVIQNLIDNQILVSELTPILSGPEFMSQILKVLRGLDGIDDLIKKVEKIELRVNNLDQSLGNSIDAYKNIIQEIEGLEVDFKIKHLFQTDLILKPQKNVINNSLKYRVLNAIRILNILTPPSSNFFLKQFKEKFYERYEERKMPLAMALDVEMGVGYNQNGISDFNPLIDALNFGNGNEEDPVEMKWSEIDFIIHKKIRNAISKQQFIVQLTDEDFKNYQANWDDLPETFSAMIEILKGEANEKVKLKYIGGSSAANLMGRFCHGDKIMLDYVKNITEVENSINKDKILAEIVHLPESRVGNILMRPNFRNFEIPYLAHSSASCKNQINISDLQINVKNGRKIILTSKKFEKEIKPKHTNAHNFTYDSLPMYNFLCDVQTDQQRDNLGIQFGTLGNEYEYVPRIEYEGIILSEAFWNISKQEIQELFEVSKNDRQLEIKLKEFLEVKNIPNWVLLPEGDNELLINFKNLTSTRMFLDTVKNKKQFKLLEFLYVQEGKNESVEDLHTNQVILSYYDSHNLRNHETS